MEDIIFDEYDEYELQKKAEIQTSKKHRYSTGFRKCALALALVVSVSTGFSAVPGRFDNMATVEAAKKKDNKKPVIKLQGAASLQVTQNESVKIPKATAKDNVDGNLTKKIKVSVKCGKKSYEDLAKKIQKNKAVKFTKIGKYVVTYTVSDKAKNKATKKRMITVVAKTEEGKTTESVTTQSPTTQQITTAATTEQVTTAATTRIEQATTTATPTTEAPTTEDNTNNTVTDFSKYDIKTITVDNNTYNVTRDKHYGNDCGNKIVNAPTTSTKINLMIENDYSSLLMDLNDKLIDDSKYLKYLGKISATDSEGKDISNNIIISEISLDYAHNGETCCIYVYIEDKKGNSLVKMFAINFRAYSGDGKYEEDSFENSGYKVIDTSPYVYGILRNE